MEGVNAQGVCVCKSEDDDAAADKRVMKQLI